MDINDKMSCPDLWVSDKQIRRRKGGSVQRVVSRTVESNPNHIGMKAWKRLSLGQKRQIIKNRSQARELATQYAAIYEAQEIANQELAQERGEESDAATETNSRGRAV